MDKKVRRKFFLEDFFSSFNLNFLEIFLFSDPEKVNRVKELYEELHLQNTYEIYEEESYKIITTHIQQISRGLPHELFFKLLEKIYRRNA